MQNGKRVKEDRKKNEGFQVIGDLRSEPQTS